MLFPGMGELLTCALEGNEGKVKAGVVPRRDSEPLVRGKTHAEVEG